MPVKRPPNGNSSGNTPLPPNTTPEVNTPRPDLPPRTSVEIPTPGGHSPRSGRPGTQADLDAIAPAPTITVHSAPSSDISHPINQSLEHYRLTAAAGLAAPDDNGLTTHKGRQYAELADGGIVQVGKDPLTGLLRATLSSESVASGPLLLRDPGSGLWHRLEDFQPVTFRLSETRLEPFRTGLDFSHAVPGHDGLHRFDGKLYVVIENHAYQVLHDADGSTPLAAVVRIVRSEDPVASDGANRYIATRPGRSEPIVFDAVQGWLGITVAGAGGMIRSSDGARAPVRLGLLDRLSLSLNKLRSAKSRAKKLFPDHTDDEIDSFIQSLGNDIADGLSRRETDYETLEVELSTWARQSTLASAPATSRNYAQEVTDSLKHCWRHQGGDTFGLETGNATLPALTADFSHVRHLTLQSVTWSDSANIFLGNFSALESLQITGSTLGTLPAAIVQMPNLNKLDLSSNRIALNEQTAAELSTLGKLKTLDLSGNPLGKTPDFAGMAELETLNLRHAQLDQWPTGLRNQAQLKQLDLRNNQLAEVPEAHLTPSTDELEAIARINSVTLLEGNPFPRDYWEKLEVFWRRVATEHPQLSTEALAGAFRLDGDMPEVATVQRLYPNKNAQEARKFFTGLDDEAKLKLARRAEELDSLEAQLKSYVDSSQTDSSGADSPARIQARRVARIIRGCWLQDPGEILRLASFNTPLPALTADFSHVRLLMLDNVTWSGDADIFLSNFAHLEHLLINNCGIETLPRAVGAMDKLTHLNLSDNRLVLDEESAATLSTLRHLELVSLSGNPALSRLPDFSNMSGVKYLRLKNTGIDQWPTGLQDKTGLSTVDLRDNRLTEVPQDFINPAPEQLLTIARINNNTQLAGNDFPPDYWKSFDDYWQRVSTEAPDLLTSQHEVTFDSDNSPTQRYQRLFPNKDIKQCREYVWSFDRDAAVTKIRSLEQEFGLLKRQLDAWVYSGGGDRGGYVRANQLALNAQTRPDRVTASEKIISCWRQETLPKLAADRTPIGLELNLSGLRLPSLPDLDVDFSHVGSLNLSNMNLGTSPEGFLTRFRHVRWLDLSQNQLRELPPAIGEMNGLTRLFLERNRISLTADTARVLSERTTLRALWLHENPLLGIAPDFSAITDLRSLNLAITGIDTFPTGIADQPLLDTINLSNNGIIEIPDAVIAPPDERLGHTVRINDVTDIAHNPLSAATLTRLTQYNDRLIQAGTPLTGLRNLVDTARGHAPVINRSSTDDPVVRWTAGFTADQLATRKIQWRRLRKQPRSDGLFNTFERLLESPTGHNELQSRVWRLIDSITENTPESERLRSEVFDRAGDAACCDRAAFTFANLETRMMMHNALAQAGDKAQGPKLFALSKALFRLHEVDKIASADIAQREAAIAAARSPLEAAALPPPHVPEEVEVRLFYRHGLKDRLQLPGQPEKMGFSRLAGVSATQLEDAYKKVIALDNSPEEFQELVAREFWQKFLTHKYQETFEKQRQPFQDRQAVLDESHSAKELSFADYETQSKAMQASLLIEEAALIETLTRQELAEYTPVNTAEEAVGASA
jgi:Leucine-rich repeat (LRR) protein